MEQELVPTSTDTVRARTETSLTPTHQQFIWCWGRVPQLAGTCEYIEVDERNERTTSIPISSSAAQFSDESITPTTLTNQSSSSPDLQQAKSNSPDNEESATIPTSNPSFNKSFAPDSLPSLNIPNDLSVVGRTRSVSNGSSINGDAGQHSSFQPTENSDSILSPRLIDAIEIQSSIREVQAANNYICALTHFGELYSWGPSGPATVGYSPNGTTIAPGTVEESESSSPIQQNSLAFRLVNGLDDSKVLSVSPFRGGLFAISIDQHVYSCKFSTHSPFFKNQASGSASEVGSPFDCTTIPSASGLRGFTANIHSIMTIQRPISTLQVVSIACGYDFTLFLSSTGTGYAVGRGSHGRLGTGSLSDATTPTPLAVESGTLLTCVSAGFSHAAAVSTDGQLLTWGCGLHGRLGLGQSLSEDHCKPTKVVSDIDAPITKVCCGYHHTLVLDANGHVWAFGGHEHGQLGLGDDSTDSDIAVPLMRTRPSLIESLTDAVVNISAGAFHSAAITSVGDLYTWGWNKWGQLGVGNCVSMPSPGLVTSLTGMDVSCVSCAADYTVAVTDHIASTDLTHLIAPSVDPSSLLSDSSDGAMPLTPNSASLQIRTPRKGLLQLMREALLVNPSPPSPPLDISSLASSTSFTHSPSSSPNRQRSRTSSDLTDAYVLKLQRGARNQASLLAEEKRRREFEEKQRLVEARKAAKREARIEESVQEWLKAIIPRWESSKTRSRARELVLKSGIPSRVRGQVWPLTVGNQLMITRELYNIFGEHATRAMNRHKLAKERNAQKHQQSSSKSAETNPSNSKTADAPSPQSAGPRSDNHSSDNIAIGKEATFSYIDVDLERTFPSLAFFQIDCAMHDQLRTILYTFCFYRPDVGYVQGMSYLAAYLLLYMPPFKAFVCLANLLNSPFFHCWLKMDKTAMNARFALLKDLLIETSPELARHLDNEGIVPDLYFLEWAITLFAKRLKLDIVGRVWDCYFLYGESMVYRVAVAILLCLRSRLLNASFDGCMKLLATAPMEIEEDVLLIEVARVTFPTSLQQRLKILMQPPEDDATSLP